LHFRERYSAFTSRWIGQSTRQCSDLLKILTLVAFLLCFFPAQANAEQPEDTSDTHEFNRPHKSPVEYVLWPVSKALQLPWWAVSQTIAQPVKLIEKENFLPTLQEWVVSFTQGGVYPVLNYESTAGLSGGVGFNYCNVFSPGVGLKVKTYYSTNTYRYAAGRLGGEHWGGGPFGLMVQAGWQAKTRERFFGIGPNSDVAYQSNYGWRGPFASITGHWQVAPKLNAKAFISLQRVDPEDGRWINYPYRRDEIAALFPDQDLLGLFERVEYVEYGIGMEHNWLTRPGSPLAGGKGLLRVSYVTGNTGNDTQIGFWKIAGEYRQYLNLFRERVVCLRVLVVRTDPDEGTRVPFYRLADLGGSSSLRGYNDGRFIGRDMIGFTFEYRWPLWRKLDAFIFTDQARVFLDLVNDFEFSNFRSSYGGGIRLWRTAGNSGLSIAWSPEATKLYFRLESE